MAASACLPALANNSWAYGPVTQAVIWARLERLCVLMTWCASRSAVSEMLPGCL